MDDLEIPAGQPNAAVLKLAFWEALTRCVVDDDGPLRLAHNDGTEPGLTFDKGIPEEVWQHMAQAIAELHAAALG